MVQCDAVHALQEHDAATAADPDQRSRLGGVCILRQAKETSVCVDSGMLQGAGLKIRSSTTCVPDLIITTPALPAPLAIIAAEPTVTSQDNSIDSPAFLRRCASMASTFRICYLLVPCMLAAHPAVLEVACDCRYKGKITLHYYVPPDGLASTVLQLLQSLVHANTSQQGIIEQQHTAFATSTEALEECLALVASIDPMLPNAEQLQALVRLGYGSLHNLAASSTAEDVMSCIGCPEEPAQRLWWLCNGIES